MTAINWQTQRILSAGQQEEADVGTEVVLMVLAPGATTTPSIQLKRVAAERSDQPAVAVRAVPLLAVLSTGEQRNATPLSAEQVVLVGQIRLEIRDALPARVEVLLRHARRFTGDGSAGVADVQVSRLVLDALDRHAYRAPDTEDVAGFAAWLTHAFAELSRDAVRDLRELRYQLERELVADLRQSPGGHLEGLLADVVELALLTARARDESLQAQREGHWAWLTHASSYHAQRHLLDPTLPPHDWQNSAPTLPWFRRYDAGVRQTREMSEELGEEVELLHHLLNGAATVAINRDAKAQETLNLIAVVGAVALGLPALILALYALEHLLPIDPQQDWVLVLPLAGATLLAAVLAFAVAGRGGRRRAGWGALAAIATLLLVLSTTWAFSHAHSPSRATDGQLDSEAGPPADAPSPPASPAETGPARLDPAPSAARPSRPDAGSSQSADSPQDTHTPSSRTNAGHR